MFKRTLVPIAAAILAATGVAACGGGGGDDSKAVKDAIVQAVTTRDAKTRCEKLSTKDFVTRVYGTPAQCLKAETPDSTDEPATGATVSNLKVDGDSATATIKTSGGNSDGATGAIDMRKEDGDWRVNDLGPDFLRSQVAVGLTKTDAGNPVTSNPEVVSCVKDTLGKLGDSELRRVAYLAIGETDAGKAEFAKLLTPCLKISSGGSENVSTLRALFEKGITQSARADGVPDAQINCIKKKLRTSVSDDDILKLAGQGDKPELSADMKLAAAKALASCAGSGSNSDASVLRTTFERGVRQSVGSGIPKKVVDCWLSAMRRKITDAQITNAVSDPKAMTKLKAKSLPLLRTCAKANP